MGDKKCWVSDRTVLEVIQTKKRTGFSKAEINISHCLIEKEPGYSFELYDEQYGKYLILQEFVEKDLDIPLHEIAIRLANEIRDKTGLEIKVNHGIQGFREEYDEHEEKMWIARMAMLGIDDDY